MTDEEILRDHLSRWSAPFVWGDADCFMSVFNYANDLRPCGIDLGVEWRGTYHDEAGALQVLARAGGGLSGMTRAMTRAGWRMVDDPARGDPICAALEGHQVGGIWLGSGFAAFRLERRGRIDMRARPLGVFRK